MIVDEMVWNPFLRFCIGVYCYNRPNTVVYNRVAFQITAPSGTCARSLTISKAPD